MSFSLGAGKRLLRIFCRYIRSLNLAVCVNRFHSMVPDWRNVYTGTTGRRKQYCGGSQLVVYSPSHSLIPVHSSRYRALTVFNDYTAAWSWLKPFFPPSIICFKACLALPVASQIVKNCLVRSVLSHCCWCQMFPRCTHLTLPDLYKTKTNTYCTVLV